MRTRLDGAASLIIQSREKGDRPGENPVGFFFGAAGGEDQVPPPVVECYGEMHITYALPMS